MSLFTKLVAKSFVETFHERRRLLITFVSLLCLLITFHYTINYYMDKVMGDLIKEFVQDQSDGFYDVEFDEIAYILNDGRFFVDDFMFDIHPNLRPSLDLENIDKGYLYKIGIPRLHIDITDFWSIFVKRKLSVIGVEIQKPYVKITNLKKSKVPKQVSLEAGNMYNTLSKYLNELQIKDFKINQGTMDYDTYKGPDYNDYKINGLTFEVNNFTLNEESDSRMDKIFYTDDIFLEVHDQIINLKDSIHQISFDKFFLSTKENEIGFTNFKLKQKSNHISSNNSRNKFLVQVPRLKFDGVDFITAYNENKLIIDSIDIQEPKVNVIQKSKNNRKDTSKIKLLDIAMMYYDHVWIDHFDLTDGTLNFTDSVLPNSKTYSIENVSAYLTEFKLDTGSFSESDYGFDFRKMDLKVSNYQVQLPDSLNSMRFSELTVSSNPFEIKVKDLSIKPDLSKDANSLLYADIPYIVVSDFDVSNAINNDSIIIGELYIERPSIRLSQKRESKKKSDLSDLCGFFGAYKVITPFADYLEISKLNLLDGELEYYNAKKNSVDIDKFSINVNDIVLAAGQDPGKDILSGAEVNVTLSDVTGLADHQSIRFGQLEYQSLDGNLIVDDVSYLKDSLASNQQITASLDHLSLNGINLNEIVFDNQVILDYLITEELNILIENRSKKLDKRPKADDEKTNFPVIKIGNLQAKNHVFHLMIDSLSRFYSDSISFQFSNFVIDQSLSDTVINQFNYKDLKLLQLANYKLNLPKLHHSIGIESIFWTNATTSLSLKNLSLYPKEQTNETIYLDIPLIDLTGIDLDKVLKNSYYIGDEITINNPTVRVKLGESKKKKKISKSLGFIPIFMRNEYHGVDARRFSIKNANVFLSRKSAADSIFLETENFSFHMDNFKIDSATEMTPQKIFFADDMRMEGEYLSIFEKEPSNFLNVNHYFISTKDQELKLDGIYFATNTRKLESEKTDYKISVDNFNISGIDFYNLILNQELNLEEIAIGRADLKIYPPPEKEEETKNFTEELPTTFPSDSSIIDDLKKVLQNSELTKILDLNKDVEDSVETKEKKYLFDTLYVKSLSIDTIKVDNSGIEVFAPDRLVKQLILPDISLNAQGILYDYLSLLDTSKLLNTNHIQARLRNATYKLPDKLNEVSAGQLYLSSRDSVIKVHNFKLTPLVDKYEYGPKKGFQSTWMGLVNDSILVNNVDFNALLKNNTFSARSIEIDRLNFSIFRDKRVPFPEWQRIPLPQVELSNIDFTLDIDTVIMNNAHVNYQEFDAKAHTPGEIFFNDLNAKVINITNSAIEIEKDPKTRVMASAYVYNRGKIDAFFEFDMQNPENIHDYWVQVDSFDIREFNRIMIPNASVQIKSGKAEKILMDVNANEIYSHGGMRFYYSDLKIQLLNRQTETPKGFGNQLGSFIANTFIIRTNNPKNFVFRKGDVYFERDKKRAIFNYWVKSFLSGVISTIGPVNNMKKIKKMQKEIDENQDQETEELTLRN